MSPRPLEDGADWVMSIVLAVSLGLVVLSSVRFLRKTGEELLEDHSTPPPTIAATRSQSPDVRYRVRARRSLTARHNRVLARRSV